MRLFDYLKTFSMYLKPNRFPFYILLGVYCYRFILELILLEE